MPEMTNSDRIRELEKIAAGHSATQESANRALDALGQEHRETVGKLDDALRELATLKEKVATLEKQRDKFGDRLWSVVPLWWPYCWD